MSGRAMREADCDFDPETAESPADRAARLATLRAQCPVAWSEAHGGFWLATRYEDVNTIAADADVFTSGKTFNAEKGVWEGGTIIPPLPMRFIPSETDSPEWDRYRGALAPHFGPKAVAARRSAFASHVHALLDEYIESGSVDIVLDIGNPLSAIGTMSLLGFPLDDWWAWAKPFHEITYHPTGSPGLAQATRDIEWVYAQMRRSIEDHRASPRADLLGHLMALEPAEGPLSDDEIFELCVQVMGGSIETTTALIANALGYLDGDAEARRRLIADRALLKPAFDEFLRYFTPVQNLARQVTKDVEIGGRRIAAGETILLSWASANRDEAVFADPDKVRIDRSPNRHVAMGRGKHFCLGAFQARMIFEVVMDAILERMPDFAILTDKAERYPSVGNVNGWVCLPACFTPGPRLAPAPAPTSSGELRR